MTDENVTISYEYNQDYVDEVCHKDEVMKVGSIVIPVFFTIVVVLSCIGNVLVLVILALYESLKSLTNIFILNLVISNLLFTFGLPFWASYYIWGWTFEDFGCKAVKFLFYAGFYSSVFFLTLMTIQRYMAVVHPLSDWEKCRGLTVSPAVVWILSGIAALMGSYYSKVIHEQSNTIYCEYESSEVKMIFIYLQNTFFVIAFLIMGFCYFRMLQTITKSRTDNIHKTVRLIFCIALVFFIVWAPYNIVMFLRSLDNYYIYPFTECNTSINLEYALFACRLIAYSHCCLNPVFYVYMDVTFQNHLKAILKGDFHRHT